MIHLVIIVRFTKLNINFKEKAIHLVMHFAELVNVTSFDDFLIGIYKSLLFTFSSLSIVV